MKRLLLFILIGLIVFRYFVYRRSFNLYGKIIQVSVSLKKIPDIFLKTEIGNECSIDDANKSDLDKIHCLRKWANKNIDRGLVENQEKIVSDNKSLWEIIRSFNKDQGGVNCGRASTTLELIYDLFGYESYVIHIGKKSEDWHTVNLVKVNLDGKTVYVVEDVVYNLSFLDGRGRPLDYFGLLKLVKNNCFDDVGIDADGSFKHDFLCIDKKECQKKCRDIQSLKDGKYKCSVDNDIYGRKQLSSYAYIRRVYARDNQKKAEQLYDKIQISLKDLP